METYSERWKSIMKKEVILIIGEAAISVVVEIARDRIEKGWGRK